MIVGGKNNEYFYDEYAGTISLTAVKNKINDNLYKKTFQAISKTLEYKNYLREREEYLELVKKYWNSNFNKIDNYLKRVLKNDYKKININFYIANPSCNVGRTVIKDNFAMFGHEKGLLQKDPNYELVYIVHECMHIMYPYEKYCNNLFDNTLYNIVHLIIEFVADYGLAVELRGREYKGHDFLSEYRELLFHEYTDYLNSDKYSSLDEFIKSMIVKYKNKLILDRRF